MTGPSAHIDPDAIRHNLSHLQGLVHPYADALLPPKFWAVVKADAYGHGLHHVIPALNHADGLVVLTLDEAYTCRRLGWSKPILLLYPEAITADLSDTRLFPLHLVIDNQEQITALEALPYPSKSHVWLRFSGQLNHAGIPASEYPQAFQRLSKLAATGHLSGLGHMQHYASAEQLETLTPEREFFQQITTGLRGPYCTENSASLLVSPEYAARTAWLRTGIALYGISPLPNIHGHELGLKPVMTLRAPIYGIQNLRCSDTLGYGNTFRAQHPLRVGLVRCGYADGYPRSLQDDCPCWVDGKPVRVIGRVSMNTLTIDISDHPDVGPGSMVTLWGSNGPSIETVATAAGTIAPQLCTALTSGVPRS